MIDIRVGDLWQYCDGKHYIITGVYFDNVSLIDIAIGREYRDYPVKRFIKLLDENSKEPLWTLASRPAGLVEQ